jgi:hypothetical protein
MFHESVSIKVRQKNRWLHGFVVTSKEFIVLLGNSFRQVLSLGSECDLRQALFENSRSYPPRKSVDISGKIHQFSMLTSRQTSVEDIFGA